MFRNAKIKWEAHRMKPETKDIYIRSAVIWKQVHRPSVKNLFGVLPITTYSMSISRTRYYEYKKMGLKVIKNSRVTDGVKFDTYYVEVTPHDQKDLKEEDFLLKGCPIKFTYYKVGKVAKLYFGKDDIGKTRYSK